MNSTPTPPYHKSEKMFRRYEQHIHNILIHFPDRCAFDPKPLSINTFICRIRDAISSVLEYNWTTCMDVSHLRDIRPSFEFVAEAGMVVCQPKGYAKARTAVGTLSEVESMTDQFLFTLDHPSDAVLHAAALLLQEKLITKPIKIKNCARTRLDELALLFDVGISDDEHGYFVML